MGEHSEKFFEPEAFSYGVKALLGFAQCRALSLAGCLDAVALMLAAAAHLHSAHEKERALRDDPATSHSRGKEVSGAEKNVET